jgi:hypothetical protein
MKDKNISMDYSLQNFSFTGHEDKK